MKTGCSQQIIKQGENPVFDPVHVLIQLIEPTQDPDLVLDDPKSTSEGVYYSSQAAFVVQSEQHEDEPTESTTKMKVKRERESSVSASEPPSKRRCHNDDVINDGPDGDIHMKSTKDLRTALRMESTRFGKTMHRIERAEHDRTYSIIRRGKEGKLIHEAAIRRSREDTLIQEAQERRRSEQYRIERASKWIRKEQNRTFNMSETMLEVSQDSRDASESAEDGLCRD
jgi:hypothetical protein